MTQKILLVEDDLRLAQMLETYLRQAGFVVSHVATGAAALDASRAEPFAAIILDLMLPDGDGLDNFTEYLLAEGPLSPFRSWCPEILREGFGVGLVLGFNRLAGRRFEVQWASEVGPSARWSRLEVEENDPRARSEDSRAKIPLPDGSTRFYRVSVAGE